MKTPEQRKQVSIAILQEHGVPYIDWLPVIEDASEAHVRSAEEIARRAIACLITIQAAFDRYNGEYTPSVADKYQHILARYKLNDALTAEENAIYNGAGGEAEITKMTWKYEAYWTLLWELGIIPELDYPAHTIDCEAACQAVFDHQDFASFMTTVRLRPIEDILDQADLIYRYHWATRDAYLNGREAPAGLDDDVIVERHAALNWLIGVDDDWDNPDTST